MTGPESETFNTCSILSLQIKLIDQLYGTHIAKKIDTSAIFMSTTLYFRQTFTDPCSNKNIYYKMSTAQTTGL